MPRSLECTILVDVTQSFKKPSASSAIEVASYLALVLTANR